MTKNVMVQQRMISMLAQRNKKKKQLEQPKAHHPFKGNLFDLSG